MTIDENCLLNRDQNYTESMEIRIRSIQCLDSASDGNGDSICNEFS